MTSANTRFTHTIHTPARGRRVSVPDESPTTTSSVHIPRENTNKYKNPSAALFVVETHVSTAAITDVPQGVLALAGALALGVTPLGIVPLLLLAGALGVALYGSRPWGLVATTAVANARGKFVFKGLRATHGGSYKLEFSYLDLTPVTIHFTTSGRLA